MARTRKYAKQDAYDWRTLSDAQLRTWFDSLSSDRVMTGRNKGCVKLRSARLGDRLLAELSRRADAKCAGKAA